MKLFNKNAEIFIPDNKPLTEAIERTTHMAVSAHQDDIEIMACDGILRCFGREDQWFFGVVVTNGKGSPRKGDYSAFSDEQMQGVRKAEQKKAAFVGEYGALAMLDYESADVKNNEKDDIVQELKMLIQTAKPEIIYTHNLADKHDSHVGVALKLIKAIRELPESLHPQKLYGCEVWRSLDWMNDEDKIIFDVSSHPNISSALIEVFDSQINGGKRYDLAAKGRRKANSTFAASHSADSSDSLIFGMDMTPLITNAHLNVNDFIKGYITRFQQDVEKRLSKLQQKIMDYYHLDNFISLT